MTLGRSPGQADLYRSTVGFVDGRVAPDSIYGLLHRQCGRLFPDEMFADLFTDVGRRSVPPMIVAVVMVLQRIEGLSDREAVDRFCFDARWKYAAGGLDFDYPGFVHTVLVDMRARLAASAAPDRIFQKVLQVAKEAGLVGRRRVLDSTPIYDAVATMDTVTLVRSAIRGLLRVADADLESRLRAVLTRDDDYTSAGKPACDWDDADARVALVDALARDGMAALAVLEGRALSEPVGQAAALLATVVGQDLEQREDGRFAIARRVGKDRVISTVDPEARHGHKTAARSFDGYKGHVGADPDSEIITATTVTPGNAGDAACAADLIADLLDEHEQTDTEDGGSDSADDSSGAVYGDNAYGTGEFHHRLERAGITDMCKTQPPSAAGGRFTKNDFRVDLDHNQVCCPAGWITPIRPTSDGGGVACFGEPCGNCPLRGQCTTSAAGRSIHISPYEQHLAAARARQTNPDWIADYRSTRPKVERKIAHLMRRRHGGRRARMRGRVKIAADFALLAAAHNLARLAILTTA